MYDYFKLTDTDKKDLMSIAERLRKSADKNLTPKVLPKDVSEEDIVFAEEHKLPTEFFQFFTIDRTDKPAG